MKHIEKHISRYFLLLAIFFLGNAATANIKLSYGTNVEDHVVSAFGSDSHENPFLFNEISIGEASQTITHNENFGFGLFAIFYSRQTHSQLELSGKINSSFSLKDKRELIFQYLFPFHFFW